MILANVGTVLGGLRAFPDASPTDGRLDVGVVKARTKFEWLRVVAGAAARRAERSPLTEMVTAEQVKIRLDRSLPWEVDGGDRDRDDHFRIRCLPAAVKIAQPWSTA